MKALILAAGLGTRLRPLTNTTPKPLLPVAGIPLLQYHLDSLRQHGINEILINTHYFADQINDFVKNYSMQNPDMLIRTSFEPELLGSAGTLRSNIDFFKDTDHFFITYGDNLTGINYTKLLIEHKNHGAMVTIASYKEPKPEMKGIIRFDQNHRILQFIEKPKPEQITTHDANAGIYIMNKSIFDYLDRNQTPLDFGHHVFPYLLEAGIPIYVYLMNSTDEPLLDIGTPKSYEEAQDLARRINKDIIERNIIK